MKVLINELTIKHTVHGLDLLCWGGEPIGVIVRQEPFLALSLEDISQDADVSKGIELAKKALAPQGYEWIVPTDDTWIPVFAKYKEVQLVLGQFGSRLYDYGFAYAYYVPGYKLKNPPTLGTRLFLEEKE